MKDDNWITGKEELGASVVTRFQNLLSAEGQEDNSINLVDCEIVNSVNTEAKCPTNS